MKKIGLTGGIGSGKSYVAEIFCHMGVPVFNSDDVAREIQNSDLTVINAIGERFPGTVNNGKIDRKALAGIVFNDAQQLAKLNSIVHPAVGKAFEQFCRDHSDAAYLIKEAAIIFEAGIDEELDGTILVIAPEAVRMQRTMQRDHSHEADVLARMKRQWTDDQKAERAAWVIQNDGERPLLPQILKIQEQIRVNV